MATPIDIKAKAVVKTVIKGTARFKTITTFVPPPIFDDDAQAYFDAVVAAGGSLSTIEKEAWNVYVLDSKNNANAWHSDTIAEYPMLGSSIDSCKINSKNPGTFDGTFFNTTAGDFLSSGWTPNGSTSYMATGIIPNTDLAFNDVTFEYYSRSTPVLVASLIGADQGASQRLMALLQNGGNDTSWYSYSFPAGFISFNPDNNNAADYHFVRRALNDSQIYKNGSSVSITSGSGGIQPTIELYLGALNSVGSPSTFTDTECAGALVGKAFTALQVLAQRNARQTLNTSLSRNV